MSDDLISREALKKTIGTIKEMALNNANEPLFEYVELNPLLDVIDNAQTVDVENQLLGAELHGIKLGYEEAQKKLIQSQGEHIEEIINELESRKSYGVEYAQVMEDVIVILKAKFDMGEKTDDD